jgi:hypothetical protein
VDSVVVEGCVVDADMMAGMLKLLEMDAKWREETVEADEVAAVGKLVVI